jgi:hypothetical protein
MAKNKQLMSGFGLEPFHADVAIMFALIGRPFAFGLTARLDQVLSTWQIKSMSLRRVGPEQAK